jgi:HEAT repeat protein
VRARTDWLAKGGAAPYVLSENLFRYFWSASTLQKKDEILRVGREAAYVGEPAVGYFADLLVLDSWPLREAKTTNMFDPETGKAMETTITHLAVDDVSRQNAALVLAAIGPPAVPTLASPAVLQAASGSARTYAAYALGRIGDDAAVAALAGVLRSSTDWKDRGAAAKALGFALPKNPSARAPLEAALQDPDRFVRKKAEDALAGKGNLEF